MSDIGALRSTAAILLSVDEPVAKTRRFLRRLDRDELVRGLRATVESDGASSDELAYYIMDELYSRDAELLAAIDRWAQALDDGRSQPQVVLDHYDAAQ